MTFQVPLPNAVHSEVIRIDAGSAVRIAGAEPLKPVFAVGRVLEVTVADRGGLGLGLMIQGQFVPAQLPKGSLAGDNLRVRVESNEDALVLRLLGETTGAKQAPGVEARVRTALSGAMASLLGVLLSEEKQTDVKRAADAFRESATQTRDNARRADDKIDLPVSLKLLFEKLRSEGATLDEKNLGNSAQVATTLAEFAERSLANSVRDARRSVELLARETQAKPLERFVQTLTTQLSELLEGQSDLGFDAKATAEELPTARPQVALSLALSHYALATGQPQALPRVTQQLAAHSGNGNPLHVLLKVAFDSPVLQFQSSGDSSGLAYAVDAMMRDLAVLRTEGAPDKLVRGAVQKHLKTLSEILSAVTKAASRPAEGNIESVVTAKTLERVLAGQDALNQVNGVLRSFGEPSLLMVPLVIQGLCIPLEVLIHPPGVSPDEEKKFKGKFQGGYQRIELRVSLPALGGVAVEIALRKEEALVSLSLESEELYTFVSAKTELLTARLREAGFKDAAVSAKQGLPESGLLCRLISPVSTVAVA